jgi:hypothetical protein
VPSLTVKLPRAWAEKLGLITLSKNEPPIGKRTSKIRIRCASIHLSWCMTSASTESSQATSDAPLQNMIAPAHLTYAVRLI